MAAVTRRKQALHDIVASSLVIDSDASASDVLRAGQAPARSPGGIFAIVLAVVCLPLAAAGTAVAIPAYQDYAVRAKVSDAVQSARGATAGVGAYMARHKAPPRSLEDARAVPSSPYLREAVITRQGAIVLTLAVTRLEGKRITFVPTAQGSGKIVWTCVSEDIATRLLPKQCRR
jgi:Tfp pilus assembly major pilin PilA